MRMRVLSQSVMVDGGGAYERKGVVNECLSQVNSYGDFIIAVFLFFN